MAPCPEHGYDRVSGEGYYRHAYDVSAARDLLLPAGPGGSGEVVLCAHDPPTGEDHRDNRVSVSPDAISPDHAASSAWGLVDRISIRGEPWASPRTVDTSP